jgi:hypothetical protein
MASRSQNSVFEAAPATESTGDMDKKTPDSPTVLAPDDSTSSVRRGGIEQPYRTYKIRWFGLVVLTLLNVMVSWSVCRSLFFSRTELHLLNEGIVH